MRPGSRSSEAFKNDVRTEAEFVLTKSSLICFTNFPSSVYTETLLKISPCFEESSVTTINSQPFENATHLGFCFWLKFTTVLRYLKPASDLGIQRASSRILRSRLAFWLCPRVPVHKGTKH